MSFGGRLLDAIAVRFSKAEIRLDELRLVDAPPKRAHGSQFNPKWMAEFGIEPKVLFDVGAYHGGVAKMLLEAFPNAMVWAFEADPSHFITCSANLLRHRIGIVKAAVTDRDGTVNWFPSANGGGHGSVYKRLDGIAQKGRSEVRGIRLDTFCHKNLIKHIDLLHIDVEGAESLALIGLGELRPSLVFLESVSRNRWLGAESSKQVHRLMMAMGYCLAGDFRTDRLYIHHSVL